MPSPDARPLEDLSADVAALANAAVGVPHVDHLLQNSLAWLARVAPYDLACVFELEGEVLRVRAARGRLVTSRVLTHVLRLDQFPSIRRALDSGQGRVVTFDDHEFGDGDAFDGVLDLPPGHSCMVVPLIATGCRVGILTLDRQQCESYAEQTVRLIEVCCQLISLALENAHQRELLDRFQLQQTTYLEALHLEALPPDVLSTYGHSQVPAIRSMIEGIQNIAPLTSPVLVQGETGVGKEVFARVLHEASPRRKQPFIKINCASMPESLLESELFGHVKGAFTGATSDRLGRFRTANGGTLFLDEIGDAPTAMQAKLLRVLQEGEFEPVGSDRTIKVDVRVIAATNVDLQQCIREKRFRADLYYRLCVFPVTLPPLRDRLSDLPVLCRVLLAEAHARNGRGPLLVSADGLELLSRYPWPGNIRELGNVLERASYLMGPTALLTRTHLEPALGIALDLTAPMRLEPGDVVAAHRGMGHPPGLSASLPMGLFPYGSVLSGGPGAFISSPTASISMGSATASSLSRANLVSTAGLVPMVSGSSGVVPGVLNAPGDRARTLDEVQRAEILRVLGETRGKVYGDDGAAHRLGLKPSTLQARMKKLGIDRRLAASNPG